MRRAFAAVLLAAAPLVDAQAPRPAARPVPISPAAQEFIAVSKQLEKAQCERRVLRNRIVAAEVEGRRGEVAKLRRRFDAIGSDPGTASLDRRLAELEQRLSDGGGRIRSREDLDAIHAYQQEARVRCLAAQPR